VTLQQDEMDERAGVNKINLLAVACAKNIIQHESKLSKTHNHDYYQCKKCGQKKLVNLRKDERALTD
jgi:DNA-directed RNA polymerase subunit RPC12/RpoP